MEKWIKFLVVLLFVSPCIYSQDEEVKHEATIIRDITPDNRVESYVEIRDSALAVIDLLKEKWGDSEEQNGKIQWSNAMIDSLEGKANVKLLHGIMKKGNQAFKTCPTSKKEKSDEVRIVRLRIMQKDKDILSSAVNSAIVLNFINEIIRQVFEGTEEDTNQGDN